MTDDQSTYEVLWPPAKSMQPSTIVVGLRLLAVAVTATGEILDGPAPCTRAPLAQICNDDGECHPNNEHCPPVAARFFFETAGVGRISEKA